MSNTRPDRNTNSSANCDSIYESKCCTKCISNNFASCNPDFSAVNVTKYATNGGTYSISIGNANRHTVRSPNKRTVSPSNITSDRDTVGSTLSTPYRSPISIAIRVPHTVSD